MKGYSTIVVLFTFDGISIKNVPFLEICNRAHWSGHVGIQNQQTLEDSAAYIQGWLDVLKSDHKLLIEAAAQAQKAVDYILA